jgi:hypothetical protein
MPIDRMFWKTLQFSDRDPFAAQCPTCDVGSLRVEQATLKGESTRSTVYCEKEDSWEHIFWEGRFCCLCKCSNANCSDSFAVVGTASCGEGDYGETYVIYQPLVFFPPLRLFRIPDGTPTDVASETACAFGQTWIDPSAAINHVRKAIELMMTFKKVPRFKLVGKKGSTNRRRPLNLHSRIEACKGITPELREQLLAIKWIGNAGSHESHAVIEDVFDCYDLLEHTLAQIYGTHDRQRHGIVRQVNRRKGPRRHSRPS